MKQLIFLCGPNGIGKTSIAKALVADLQGTAYVDTDPLRYMNPFILNDETIPTIASNISDVIKNYLACPLVDRVVFTYGFHGRRRQVFDQVLANLNWIDYSFHPFHLTCNQEENVRRMLADGRDQARIDRAIKYSRPAYVDLTYDTLDISDLSLTGAKDRLLELISGLGQGQVKENVE